MEQDYSLIHMPTPEGGQVRSFVALSGENSATRHVQQVFSPHTFQL